MKFPAHINRYQDHDGLVTDILGADKGFADLDEVVRRANAFDKLIEALKDIRDTHYMEADDCEEVARDTLKEIGEST